MEVVMYKIEIEKYPAYKDSGEQWIGNIPKHWEVRKLKHLFTEKKHTTNPALSCGSISYGKVVVKDDEKIPLSTKASYQEVLKGEFLINPLNLNYDLISLRIALSNINVVVSPGYIVLKNIAELNKDYFKYLLHRYDVAYMKLLGSGVRQTISFTHIANSYLLYPPIEEQTAIAAFLDRKTALIDKAIAQKEKLIELLKERRQILIHKAVTRGIDPNVKMKDSGVEWIGEIPEHWDILPGFRFFKENNRKNTGMQEDCVLSLSYGNIIVKPVEKLVGLVPESFETYQIVEPGDIIVRCTDLQNDQTSLRTGLARNKGIITSAYLNFSVAKGNNPQYLHYFLHMLDITKVIYMFGSGLRQNLNFKDFKRMPTISAPLKDQNEIVDFINKLHLKTRNAIDLADKEIEKLKEYRATLINATVTGKININQ